MPLRPWVVVVTSYSLWHSCFVYFWQYWWLKSAKFVSDASSFDSLSFLSLPIPKSLVSLLLSLSLSLLRSRLSPLLRTFPISSLLLFQTPLIYGLSLSISFHISEELPKPRVDTSFYDIIRHNITVCFLPSVFYSALSMFPQSFFQINFWLAFPTLFLHEYCDRTTEIFPSHEINFIV